MRAIPKRYAQRTPELRSSEWVSRCLCNCSASNSCPTAEKWRFLGCGQHLSNRFSSLIRSMNTGEGYWKLDLGGAIVHTAWTFLQRDVKLTHMNWSWNDLVEGRSLQLTNNADKSRTFVHIALHRTSCTSWRPPCRPAIPRQGCFSSRCVRGGVEVSVQHTSNQHGSGPLDQPIEGVV